MKKIERKNIVFRLISCFFLLLFLAFLSFAFYKIISFSPSSIVLDYIALILTALFSILQMIFILKGWKKDSHLYDIAFNKNGSLNTLAFVMVIIGTIISIGLSIMSLILYFLKSDIEIKSNLLIIATICLYLLANCIIYHTYLIFFRKKAFKIEDLIK